jgi:hypothetical protein
VHEIDRAAGDAGEIAGAADRLRLDERRARGVPRGKAAFAARIGAADTLAQHEGDLDRLRMRADHAARPACGLEQAEEEAVVDVRQAEALAFPAAVVEEDLEARHAEVAGQGRDAGKLRLRRDDRVVGEVDPRACFGGGDHLRQHLLVGRGREEIGDETGDASGRRREGLLRRVRRRTRAGDIRPVAEMQMHIHRAGQHDEARDRHALLGRISGARGKDGGDPPAGDGKIGRDRLLRPGQDDAPAGEHEVSRRHGRSPPRAGRRAPQDRQRSASPRRISPPCRTD